MNIMRYSPFRDFENFMGNWRWPMDENGFEQTRSAKWVPSVDISESEKEFLLKLEVPEVKKEDLHVEVSNGMLTVTGERRFEKADKKQHRTERFYGRFERSFALPENVRQDNIEAEQKDGMLYIRLGKKDIEQAPRKLDIKVS